MELAISDERNLYLHANKYSKPPTANQSFVEPTRTDKPRDASIDDKSVKRHQMYKQESYVYDLELMKPRKM